MPSGRAIDILQSSLPEFFHTGLVSTGYHLPIHLHSLLDVGGENSKSKAADRESQEEGIYARHIRLEYTPPVALPAPLPRVLSVEGEIIYFVLFVCMLTTYTTRFTPLRCILRLCARNPRDTVHRPRCQYSQNIYSKWYFRI